MSTLAGTNSPEEVFVMSNTTIPTTEPVRPRLEDTYLLTDKQVCQITGLSRPFVWKHTKLGKFPQPVRLSSRCTRWRRSDIMDWLESL